MWQGCDSRQILLCNTQTGRFVQRFGFKGTLAFCLAFSPDVRFLVSGHFAQSKRDGKWYDAEHCVLKLWDLKSGRVLRSFRGHTGPIVDVEFLPDGGHILSASSGWFEREKFIKSDDRSIRLWDLATGVELVRYLPEEDIRSIAFAPDGRTFLSAGRGTLRLWDVPPSITAKPQPLTEVRRFKGHKHWITGLALTPDGRQAVSVANDHNVRIWDVSTGNTIRRIELEKAATAVDLSNHARFLAVAVGSWAKKKDAALGLVLLLDFETGKEIRRFEGHANTITAVAFSPDDRLLATAASDGTSRLWNVATGEELRRLDEREGTIGGVQFTPDGRRLVTCEQFRAAHVWNVETGRLLHRLGREGKTELRGIELAPDGRTVLLFNGRGAFELYDVETVRSVGRFNSSAESVPTDVLFTRDGRRLLVGSTDKTLRLLEVRNGRELANATADKHVFNVLAISPDGRFVLSGGGKYWDPVNPAALDSDFAVHLWRLPESVWPAAAQAEKPETQKVPRAAVSKRNEEHARAAAQIEKLGGVVRTVKDEKSGELFTTVGLRKEWKGGEAGFVGSSRKLGL